MPDNERMIPVPESALRALNARQRVRVSGPTYITVEEIEAINRLVACLPEPEHDHKGFSEEKCVRCGWVMGHQPLNCANDNTPHVFPSQQALCPPPPSKAQRHQDHYRSCGCLGDSATCCDPECCPPPSPELVEVVEAAREYLSTFCGVGSSLVARLAAAVAAYDEQEEG